MTATFAAGSIFSRLDVSIASHRRGEESRSAGGNASRFAEAARELVRLKVDVIYPVSAPAVHAAHAATRNIPIVGMDYSTDPVAAGYADSYGHPGQNLTGVFLDAPEFTGKWLEILQTMVPHLSHVAVLWHPAPGPVHLPVVQNSARSLGIQVSERTRTFDCAIDPEESH